MRSVMEIGPKTYHFKPGDRAFFQVSEQSGLYAVNTDGEIVKRLMTLIPGKNNNIRFDTEAVLCVNCSKHAHWSLDIQENIGSEQLDGTPVEIPEDALQPETLEAKLKRHMGILIADMYGRNSDEYETFEEANDLDWDGDGMVTPYEQNAMADDYNMEQKAKEKADQETVKKTEEAETTQETTEVTTTPGIAEPEKVDDTASD